MFNDYVRGLGLETVPGRDRAPWVIAHRGYSGVAPENTLAAVDAALTLGCDMVEIDVRLSADGTPVVIHDANIARTTNAQGAVELMNDERLSFADAGSWQAPGFAGQRIPSLRRVIETIAKREGRLLLEFKDDWTPGAAAKVSSLVIEFGMADRTVFQSFSVPTLEVLRDMVPNVPRMLVREHVKESDADLALGLGVVAYNPSYKVLKSHPALISRIRRAGLGVLVWTPDNPDQWGPLVQAQVNGIITNQPGRLQGYLAAREQVISA